MERAAGFEPDRPNSTPVAATPAPHYLAMIVPVIVAGVGIVPLSLYGWIALGTIAFGGSRLIWFATERAWGKFRQAA